MIESKSTTCHWEAIASIGDRCIENWISKNLSHRANERALDDLTSGRDFDNLGPWTRLFVDVQHRPAHTAATTLQTSS